MQNGYNLLFGICKTILHLYLVFVHQYSQFFSLWRWTDTLCLEQPSPLKKDSGEFGLIFCLEIWLKRQFRKVLDKMEKGTEAKPLKTIWFNMRQVR